MKNNIFLLTIVLLGLIVSSCSTSRQGNFNFQKFTDLKPISLDVKKDNELTKSTTLNLTDIVKDTLENSTCDTIYLKTGKEIKCIIVSENSDFIKYTDCPSYNQTYSMDKDLVVPNNELSHYATGPEYDCEVIWLDNDDSVVGQIVTQTRYYMKYIKCNDDSDSIFTYKFDYAEKPKPDESKQLKKRWPILLIISILLFGLAAITGYVAAFGGIPLVIPALCLILSGIFFIGAISNGIKWRNK